MDRDYDIFEQLPDSLRWRDAAHGLKKARQRLQEIAKSTTNECFLMHTPTMEVIARMNTAQGSGKRTVFQIAYDEQLLVTRAALLRRQGYEVTSVIGNETAKVVLSRHEHYDVFILGHAAPHEDRKQMVAWLKRRYPKGIVVALNPPQIRQLAGADYNIIQNGSEQLLSTVASAVGP
jgi:hypothetical protein